MKAQIPQPSIPVLLAECTIVLVFAAGLYFFISALMARNDYTIAIHRLNQKRQTMIQAARTVDSYRKFVHTHPFYQRSSGDLQWEKNDEVWINLEYEELLARLSDLYREDRPFILDSFTAGLVSEIGKAEGEEQGKTGQNKAASDTREKQLTFRLQGYFLCPCK